MPTPDAHPAADRAQRGSDAQHRIRDVIERQRRAFLRDGFPSADLRIARLDRLIDAVIAHEAQIVVACTQDFGHRSRDGSRMLDVAAVIEGAKYCKQHLRNWMEPVPRKVALPRALLGAKGEVRYQPLGVVGIMSPWNVPVLLALAPLAGVLAAGNRAVLKPSERTPATAEVIAELIDAAFDPAEVAVVTGGPEVGAAFARQPFDRLVFTGGAATGREVLRAAADHLVPVTLELGGKCPAIVGRTARLRGAALKIMHGKCLNAGQSCLAPDYVLAPDERQGELVEALRAAVARMFGGLRDNPDYTSIIDDRHRDRLEQHLADARAKGADVVPLNPRRESFARGTTNKMPPTLVLNVRRDMTVMNEEIFGPILPIESYRTFDQALEAVNARPRPLALYYFGANRDERERVLSHTTSGGVTVNDVIAHAAQEDLPLGGVGPSGMGAYHAHEGFLAFSHARSVFTQARADLLGNLLRPPFGTAHRMVMRGLIRP